MGIMNRLFFAHMKSLCIVRSSNLRNKQPISEYRTTCSTLEYVQGQSPEKNIREYFYYINHQGMVGKINIFI